MSRPKRRNKWEARLEGVTALGPLSKKVVDKWMTAAITKTTPIVHAAIASAAPSVSGRQRVRGGVRMEVVPSGRRFSIPVVGRVWLRGAAIPVQTGARAHDIPARNGKVLKFAGRRGRAQYAPRVEHRGTAPNDFFNRGVEAAAPEVDAFFSAAADQIARELAQ